MRRLILLLSATALGVALAACATDGEPTATAPPPLPTDTPAPTATPEPTATPTSTPTATPTPVPMSVFVPDEPLLFENDFEGEPPVPGSWFVSDSVSFENGLVLVNPHPDWDGLTSEARWVSGQTILLNFRYAPGSQNDMSAATGNWDTPTFRQWGMEIAYGLPRPVHWIGRQWLPLNWQRGFVQTSADQWYVLMIHIGSSEEDFVVRLWNQEDPTQFMETRFLPDDESWGNQQWTVFMQTGPQGGLEIDRLEVIEGLPDLSGWEPQ